MSDLNIKNYYNKNQIKRDLNRLYDESEIQKNNNNFNIYKKIEDLEILLEMYENDILKENNK